MDTALLAELFDQLPTLLFRQVTAGLDGIDQQLQLCDLENTGANVVAAVFAGDGNDIHAVILQSSNIGIDGLAITGNVVLPVQHINELRGFDQPMLMGVLFQVIPNI